MKTNEDKPMTDHELQLKLAEACPEILHVSDIDGVVEWKNTGDAVTSREMLEVMRECEDTLEISSAKLFLKELENTLGMLAFHASWQLRALAFLKVKS